MNVRAILLYGSRARGDATSTSDTDLIAVTDSGSPERVIEYSGVSIHAYPRAWLMMEAAAGSLFTLHLIREGVPLFDPTGFFTDLASAFIYKGGYKADLEAGARVVLAFARMNADNFTANMRRRYFWGLRTAIMAQAAERRTPVFSAEALETFVQVAGLAQHIHHRNTAEFNECQHFGPIAVAALGGEVESIIHSDVQDNLNRLFEFGGVAGATAGEIIYGF